VFCIAVRRRERKRSALSRCYPTSSVLKKEVLGRTNLLTFPT
jgi:hypothetical protein